MHEVGVSRGEVESLSVEICDVAVRDGLQNETRLLSTDDKLTLIRRLVDAGLRSIEVASFANPERVPSMADAEAVCAGLPVGDGVRYRGLVLNDIGFERARRTGLDELAVVVVATDTFSMKNQGMTTAAAAATWNRIAGSARRDGFRTSVTIAAAFGCPYEGEVPVKRVAEVAALIAAGDPDEIIVADTIGVAVPYDVEAVIATIRDVAPGVRLGAHFHNTRDTALANIAAAIGAGVRSFDSSTGGIGGCPFAPGATGNVATEDVVYMLNRMKIATGISLDALVKVVPWLESRVGHRAAGVLARAGDFPKGRYELTGGA